MTLMSEPLIRFRDVTKEFARPDGAGTFTAVDRLSFTIEKGEIVAVLGKTGCGKSTMFNLLAGLIEPIEREFGITVMAASQACIWDALRLVGVHDRIEGYGRLLRQF